EFKNGETMGGSGSIRWLKVEPIRWLIANWDSLPASINPKGNGTATEMNLVANEIVTAGIPFHSSSSSWETSFAREFLNGAFLNEAFSAGERSAINISEQSDVGTNDKVFLPSYADIFSGGTYANLFNSYAKRMASITDFGIANNGYMWYGIGSGNWWLRSAYSSDNAWIVYDNGDWYGRWVADSRIGLRPAFSLALSYVSDIQNPVAHGDTKFDGFGRAYMELGEYPRTYAGNALNQTLESLYNAGSLTATGKTYTSNSSTSSGTYVPKQSPEYIYENNKYVRVSTLTQDSSYEFKNGETMGGSGSIRWLKVEPIRWLIANWDSLPASINPNGNGTATDMQLVAEEIITAGIPFHSSSSVWATSVAREFLNGAFLNEAFSEEERNAINISLLSDVGTEDKIFLPSYNDVFGSGNHMFNTYAKRVATITDFGIANYGYMFYGANSGDWWLRSAYSSGYAWVVDDYGNWFDHWVDLSHIGLRPAFSLALS
ncbi:MAG: DUF6273 domain-containing protein, partial [Firmicutes bacterium]|nr:DUF6273 domain-containing protein [Bacillota bacterium]